MLIRPAISDDLAALLAMRRASIAAINGGYDTATIQEWLQFDPTDRYLETIGRNNLLVADSGENILGCAGLYLPNQSLIATFVHPSSSGLGVGTALVRAVEDRARTFGLRVLQVDAALNACDFYRHCGYEPDEHGATSHSKRLGFAMQVFHKNLAAGFSGYQRRILALLQTLGITCDYGVDRQLPMLEEARELVSIGTDVFDRDQQMVPVAAAAWAAMQSAARADGVELLPVSAFRSVEYQAELLRRKLAKGQQLEDILRVSAAPGFSEHHGGCAIDIASSKENALEEIFEQSPGFAWLSEQASRYGFVMSYPRDNPHGIAYEPWHWAWRA